MPVSKDALLKSIQQLRESTPKRKFSQSLELSIMLKDLDLKKPESRITGAFDLPNPINKPAKICVFASGQLASTAKTAGADAVLGREEIERFSQDKKSAKKLANEYDAFVAEAPLMPSLGKILGPFLGPRGKMPTPVAPGAPIQDIISRHRSRVKVRMKDQPVIQCRIGTEDMPDANIAENVQSVVSQIESKLERGARNIRTILIKASMGPKIKVTLERS